MTATMIGTNAKRMVPSSDNGDFTIPGLAPGTYQVMAEHEGFKQTVVGRVELLVNQTARVNVVLQVGTVAESVEVTGAAPLVASESSTLGQVVTTKQIEDLPLKGRAVFNLALLSPGTAPRRLSSYAGQQRPMPGGLGSPVFSAAGGRDNSNGYLVDGIEAVDPHYMTPSSVSSDGLDAGVQNPDEFLLCRVRQVRRTSQCRLRNRETTPFTARRTSSFGITTWMPLTSSRTWPVFPSRR